LRRSWKRMGPPRAMVRARWSAGPTSNVAAGESDLVALVPTRLATTAKTRMPPRTPAIPVSTTVVAFACRRARPGVGGEATLLVCVHGASGPGGGGQGGPRRARPRGQGRRAGAPGRRVRGGLRRAAADAGTGGRTGGPGGCRRGGLVDP